jgi:hypothetical protein
MKIKSAILFLLFFIIGCGPSKELLQLSEQFDKPEKIDVSKYIKRLPSDCDEWFIKANEIVEKTPDCVKSNQVGGRMIRDSIEIYFCMPYAFPTASIDTQISLKSQKELLGYYGLIQNEVIMYTDSISVVDTTVTQSEKELSSGTDDAIMEIDHKKIVLFAKEGRKDYQKKIDHTYRLLDGRYLLIEPTSNAPCSETATNFVGMTAKGILIMDTYKQIRLTKPGEYLVSKITANRWVFKKLK